jgi:hypothetical protein
MKKTVLAAMLSIAVFSASAQTLINQQSTVTGGYGSTSLVDTNSTSNSVSNVTTNNTSTATSTNTNTSTVNSTSVNTNNNVNSGTVTYNNNNVQSGTLTNINQNTTSGTMTYNNNNVNSGELTYNNNNNNNNNSTSTNNNVNQNIQSGSLTNINRNDSNITQKIVQPPPTAIAPMMMSVGTDLCVTGVSGATQTQIFGLSFGATKRDANCERLKLSKTLFDMGMKVAAVATMCQDRRVFDAMLQAGTPCPYEGLIGEQARVAWAANPDKIPTIGLKE